MAVSDLVRAFVALGFVLILRYPTSVSIPRTVAVVASPFFSSGLRDSVRVAGS